MSARNHLCNYLVQFLNYPSFDLSVLSEEDNVWMLRYVSFTNENMVRDGEARETGEIISEIELKIYYCPFCGNKL